MQLLFGNLADLKTVNKQMAVEAPMAPPFTLAKGEGDANTRTTVSFRIILLEDIGRITLGHRQVTITLALLSKLLANNTAAVGCDDTNNPASMLLDIDNGRTLQG